MTVNIPEKLKNEKTRRVKVVNALRPGEDIIGGVQGRIFQIPDGSVCELPESIIHNLSTRKRVRYEMNDLKVGQQAKKTEINMFHAIDVGREEQPQKANKVAEELQAARNGEEE